MPVRRGNHRFSGPERVSQRAGSNLSFVEIWRNVEIRRADELFQVLQIDELVKKNGNSSGG
jgi:hypothetical protein